MVYQKVKNTYGDSCNRGHVFTQETAYLTKAGYLTCKPCHKQHQLMYKFGITLEELDYLLETQDFKCAIGGEDIDAFTARVDHDHSCCPGQKTCGKCVRSLLCHKCNVSLGLMNDDPEKLIKAANYLISFKESKPNGSN